MAEIFEIKTIAHIRTDFNEKFGIPRQSGLVEGLKGEIIFEPEYRREEALKGIEGFTHLWLLWIFSKAEQKSWSPTVRPPRLGGNKRMGVFATRSPFRPNPIGLSCVKLERIRRDKKYGTVIEVSGADMLDNTPIIDIKPYLPFADSIPNAAGGFADEHMENRLSVSVSDELISLLPPNKRQTLIKIIEQDPRPAYQNEPDREYGFDFAGFEVKFTVSGSTAVITDIICKDDRQSYSSL